MSVIAAPADSLSLLTTTGQNCASALASVRHLHVAGPKAAEDDKEDPKHVSKVFNLASKLGAGVAAMTGFGMATADGAVDGATDGATGGMVSAAAVASVDEDPSKLSAGTATPPNCVKVPLWICTATLAAALFGIVAITMTLPA
jgi:hypothetical protein